MRAVRGGTFRIGVEPTDVQWFVRGDQPDWIGQSGVIGATKIKLPTALNQKDARAQRVFDVIFYFAEPHGKPGENVFDVLVEGDVVINDLDVAASGNSMVLRRVSDVLVTGALDIELKAKSGQSVLCGVKLIQKLKAD